jgi:hypothetical protein
LMFTHKLPTLCLLHGPRFIKREVGEA